MKRKTSTLEDRIQKAQIEVTTAKEKYEKALDELEKLLTKRREHIKIVYSSYRKAIQAVCTV